jgi:hypothetical protein
MLMEKLIIKASLVTSAASLAIVNGLTDKVINQPAHLDLFQDLHEFELVLWSVGGLLSIIALLIGLLCKFVWDMKVDNRKQHANLFRRDDQIAHILDQLQGEHNAAFNLRACAYEPERFREILEVIVKDAVDEAMPKGEEDEKLNFDD